jgi:hypothetical protein
MSCPSQSECATGEIERPRAEHDVLGARLLHLGYAIDHVQDLQQRPMVQMHGEEEEVGELQAQSSARARQLNPYHQKVVCAFSSPYPNFYSRSSIGTPKGRGSCSFG